ncbi:uncharacterized protein LOC124411423 [Diprion similis]|uniref:uncharacterized protein LOC124411423 n=1 Tax=Diprion similis TaxID=362088 RepID=UPI001EF786D7|nr:uncharacterized protein LOC124411423 [Diprion similis]
MSRGKKTKKKVPRRRQETSSLLTANHHTEMHAATFRGGVAGTSKADSFLRFPLKGEKLQAHPRSPFNFDNGQVHVESSSPTPNRRSPKSLSTVFNAAELEKLKETLHVSDLSYMPLLLGAVVLEKRDTVKSLLRDGHRVDSCAKDKSTPLMWAVRKKNLEMINVLMQHDADPTLLDNNTDNVALIAIQSTTWDENDFLDFWKTINYRMDLDHANVTGNTILHYAIKRQWSVLVEQILKTEANVNCANVKGVTPLMMAGIRVNPSMVSALLRNHADVSREDSRGCTALCYSIACSMQKKLDIPHPSLQKLVCAVNAEESNLTIESYLKRRLELLICPPEQAENFTSTINSIIRSVFGFFAQYTQSGLKIFLHLDVFEKIRKAVEEHMENWNYLQAILGILIDLLCHWDCCTNGDTAKIPESDLMDSFATADLPNACLRVLRRYRATNCVVSSGLEPIFAKCTTHGKTREWLEENRDHIEPYYSNLLQENHKMQLQTPTEDQKHRLFSTIMQFRYLMRNFKQRSDTALESLPDSSFSKSDRPLKINQSSTSPEHSPAQSVGSSKKQRRKIKTLRMKLAKMRGLRLVEHNGSSCVQSEAGVKYFSKSTRPPMSHHGNPAIQIEHQSPRPMFRRQNQSLYRRKDCASWKPAERIEIEDSMEVFDCNFSTSNVELKPKIGEENSAANGKELSVAGDVAGLKTPRTTEETLECISKVSNPGDFLDDAALSQTRRALEDNNNSCNNDTPYQPYTSQVDESNNSSEYVPDNVEATISYLSNLFEEIISCYRRNWKHDRESGYPGYKGGQGDLVAATEEQIEIRIEEIARLNTILPKLEDSCINKLTESWLSLISKVRETANRDFKKYKSVVTLLQLHLLMYKVSPTNDFDKSTEKSGISKPLENDQLNKKLGTIGDGGMKKENERQSDFLSESATKMHYGGSYETEETQYRMIPQRVENAFLDEAESTDSDGDAPARVLDKQDELQTTTYQCCEQGMLEQSTNPVTPGNTTTVVYTAQIIEARRTQVNVNSTTHTFAELLRTRSADVFSAVPVPPPLIHLRTTRATGLTFAENPWMQLKNRRTLNARKGAPAAQAYVSRWDVLLKGFRAHLNHKTHGPGEAVLISASEQRKHFTISLGGNFGPIELGLDTDGRPLAVRRLRREDSALILSALTPLLAIRHGNILPFFISADDGADVIIGTPLCEYNLGEYLMYLKIGKGLEERSLVLVKQFLVGLYFLHNNDVPVVHGNIKPSNLMIDRAGVLRLAEFGLWKSLYRSSRPPSSSMIWFSRESYENYEENEVLDCTCASDIQIAGMVVHFILTGGLHPYGTQTSDILDNIRRGYPTIQCQGCEIVDLISWMLVIDPLDRPSINQVLTHVFFWDSNKKWSFLLACAGINANGEVLPLPLESFHRDLEAKAISDQVKGDWLSIVRTQFPALVLNEGQYSNSPTGLLVFVRRLLESEPVACQSAVPQFILSAFPTLTLSLYRLLEATRWHSHPVFSSYVRVN